jgi:hypothetical protein
MVIGSVPLFRPRSLSLRTDRFVRPRSPAMILPVLARGGRRRYGMGPAGRSVVRLPLRLGAARGARHMVRGVDHGERPVGEDRTAAREGHEGDALDQPGKVENPVLRSRRHVVGCGVRPGGQSAKGRDLAATAPPLPWW